MVEHKVISVVELERIPLVLNEAAQEGWELIQAYQGTSGGFLFSWFLG